MKLFVTGATGFIGSHFVNAAHQAGHELHCIRRAESRPRITLEKEPNWHFGSLDDDWSKILKECDTIIHLAAHSTNVPYDTLESCLYWNLTVTLKLMEQARISGIKKFIVAGTGFEYGKAGERYEKIPVDAPLEPTMTYPASKAVAAVALTQWTMEHKLKLQYIRIFQDFGEGEAASRLWPSLKKAAETGEDFQLTPGEQVRDFTPVELVATQLVEALNFKKVKVGIPYISHVGTGEPKTLREFAEYWWKQWGATGKLHFGSQPYRQNEVMRFVPKI